MRTNRSHYFLLIRRTWKQNPSIVRFLTIMIRLLLWIYCDKGTFISFFLLGLNEKTRNPKNLFTEKEFIRLHDSLNPVYYRVLLEDKYLFDRFMNSFGFPVAKTLGYISGDEVYWIKENKREPIEKLISQHLDCFVKQITQWGGKNVFKLSVRDEKVFVNTSPSDLSDIRQLTKIGIYVIQNRIQQHPVLDHLNSTCVNTIRMITIVNGSVPQNFYNFLRMGVNASVMDNLSSGGLGCGIHPDGTLFDTASDVYFNHFRITHHPDSKVAFKTIRIPFFHDALKLVVSMHTSLHCFFMVAWDIAITAEGPVVLEANPLAGFLYEQSIYGPFKEEIMQYAKRYAQNNPCKSPVKPSPMI